MRYLAVALLLMGCTPARAATMCMPDKGLSTMTDVCTPIKFANNVWWADCNGVEVSGVAFSGHACHSSTGMCSSMIFAPSDSTSYCSCLMLRPHRAKCILSVTLAYSGICSNYAGVYSSCAEACANLYVPSLGFTATSHKNFPDGCIGGIGGSGD